MKKLLAVTFITAFLVGCAQQGLESYALQLSRTAPLAPTSVATPAPKESELPAIATAINEALPVQDQHRAIRACLLTAGFAFLLESKADYGLTDRSAALGAVQTLKTAVERARLGDPNWRNVHMGQALIAAGHIGLAIGRDKVTSYLTRGLSIETALFAGRSLAIDGVMISMSAHDVREILRKLEAGEMTEADAWATCEVGLSEAIQGLS